MKKILLMMILVSSLNVTADDMTPAEDCIAENSGAASIDCLKNLYEKLNQEMDQLNQDMVLSLEARHKQDQITSAHFEQALVALNRSILDFKLYRKSSCDAQAYYSGAVASGYSQVLYQCLIKQTETRSQFLTNRLTN